jgi:hypothetical protein
MQHRATVLLTFCEPIPNACSQLQSLSITDWQRLLYWLDTSGLALYFLDRVTELELCGMLPPTVHSRLEQNLADNTARTNAMIVESTVVHRLFQRAGLSYAMLKGFSLWPISVPKLELRSQLDLDFLVAEESAHEARKILEAIGYHLQAVSGRSWEFKTSCAGASSLAELYRPMPHRSVELHIEAHSSGQYSLLTRTELRPFHSISMPVLPPADLFLGQGLHLYKHICSSFSRTAHFIEFRRHILVRHHDDAFWRSLRRLAEQDRKAPPALGIVVLLISQMMGDFAPDTLTCWTVERIPPGARLWVELYGYRAMLGSFPGTKLYLLLQKEMEIAGVPVKQPLRQALIPTRLPPAIEHRAADEGFAPRILRYRRQLRFILFRLRFHVVEGLRYLCESVRWRSRLKRLTE